MNELATATALSNGVDPRSATAGLVLVHGRGATARAMLELAPELAPTSVTVVAPLAAEETAAGGTWYPYGFMAPRASNEPWLGESLERLRQVVDELLEAGLGERSIVLAGFSQGACLALEFSARRGGPLGGVAAWTGGLVGESIEPAALRSGLEGTPVFLGAGDPDPHVPWRRVEESAEVLEGLGAAAEVERYPGMPHIINEREIAWVRERLDALMRPREAPHPETLQRPASLD